VSGQKVLVTGGYGFVGSRVCGYLVTAGYDVAVFDDCRLGRPENLAELTRAEVRHFVGDICDTAGLVTAMEVFAPAVVLHLAAIHFIPLCNAHPRLAVDVNVSGTQSVLDACGEVAAVEGIVFASSGAVYAPSDEPLREDSSVGPTDIYGSTKLWGEALMELHRAKTGVGLGIARLFNVYGPGETNPHFVPSVLLQVAKGGDLKLGNLDTRRDYVYVGDVAVALAALIERAGSGSYVTCNLGTGSARSGREVLQEIEGLTGRVLTVSQDDVLVRASDRLVLLSDPREAREQLCWAAEMPLRDGLRVALAAPLAAGSVALEP
jgi:UDP-glucose 4-epimerase